MTTYEYADGNGNIFVISAAALVYQPVKPAESSSGFYSGGKPQTVPLTKDQFQVIVRVMDNAIKNKEVHDANRVVMSGAITVISDERKQVILKPGTQELAEIDSLLKGLLKN